MNVLEEPLEEDLHAAGKHRLFRYHIASETAHGLDSEARRALALFYALNMVQDAVAINVLLRYGGQEPQLKNGSLMISQGACVGLAQALRRTGYPLDDDGIKRFKLERGFAATVRLGPETARAYARFARGVEARLNITNDDWHTLDEEGRRALQILLLIGRSPSELTAVRGVLGVRNAAVAAQGPILIGKVSAMRLVSWAHHNGIHLTQAGVDQITAALGPTGSAMQDLAGFVADAILCRSEPRHDYSRLRYQDHVLNRRTVTMLNRAAALLKPTPTLRVIRGSYETESFRGAHPHKGGGVVDLTLSDNEPESRSRAIAALRTEGFAAWWRDRGHADQHIHAIAIGDRELAAAAKWQVREFFAGHDGRTRSGPDTHAELDCCSPPWTVKYRLLCCAPPPNPPVSAANADLNAELQQTPQTGGC